MTFQLAPDVSVIEPSVIEPSATGSLSPAGVFAGRLDGPHDLILTGLDALNWYSTAMASSDVILAVWPHPDELVVIYGGPDPATIAERLDSGTVVLVAGADLGADVAGVASRRVEAPSELIDFFGFDRLVVSSEPPVDAALRRFGEHGDAAELLGCVGATVTVLARASTAVAEAVSDHIQASFTYDRASRSDPSLVARLAWTRQLGSFQLQEVPAGQSPSTASTNSATILGSTAARQRAEELLAGNGGDYDLIASADIGGSTSTATDLVAAFGGTGLVLVSPISIERPIVVLHNEAARIARAEMPVSDLAPLVGSPDADTVVIGPPPADDADRLIAHQWARNLRQAELATNNKSPVGGPTLATEADSIGLVGPLPQWQSSDPELPAVDTSQWVDGQTVAAIARARGWHEVDQARVPTLDSGLAATYAQLSGSAQAVESRVWRQVAEWGQEPGFWAGLSSAVELGADDDGDDLLIFPYPPVAVELLQLMVASSGEAAELRRLAGPLRVAVASAIGGDHVEG